LSREAVLRDAELSFDGAAPPPVLEAWRRRLARMPRLRELAGPAWDEVAGGVLDCLARDDHTTECRVHFCLGVAPG
jgi:hypothetical protein